MRAGCRVAANHRRSCTPSRQLRPFSWPQTHGQISFSPQPDYRACLSDPLRYRRPLALAVVRAAPPGQRSWHRHWQAVPLWRCSDAGRSSVPARRGGTAAGTGADWSSLQRLHHASASRGVVRTPSTIQELSLSAAVRLPCRGCGLLRRRRRPRCASSPSLLSGRFHQGQRPLGPSWTALRLHVMA